MSKPLEILGALESALSVITTTAPYVTGIGANIQLHDVIRSTSKLPGIAIGTSSGTMTIGGDDPLTQRPYASNIRSLDFTIEAAVKASKVHAQQLGLQMLGDIERALAGAVNCIKPNGVRNLKFDDWAILESPSGIDAVVLRINGTAEYLQPRNT